jgi:uncharacterized protein (TIGR00369 family)
MSAENPYREFGVVAKEVAIGMSGIEFLTRLRDKGLPAPPFAEVADIWITEITAGRVVFEAIPSARFYNPLGTVHGGWISTLLDSAMGCAVHSMMKAGQAYTTVDLAVSFVRPVFEKTGKLKCEGTALHVGGRVATALGKVWDQGGTLIAHGSETCLVMNVPGAGQ